MAKHDSSLLQFVKDMESESLIFMQSLSSKIRKKFIVDQLPNLGRRMAHAAAACSQDKQQHLERVVAPEEKGFDGWHALTCDTCRREDKKLWRF